MYLIRLHTQIYFNGGRREWQRVIKGGGIDGGEREWWTEGEVESEGQGRDGVMEGGME